MKRVFWQATTAIFTGGLLAVVFAFTSCRTAPPPVRPTAEFRPAKLMEIDEVIQAAVANRQIPGGVFWLERLGLSYDKAYGNRMLEPTVAPMREDTIFDAASLTKVIATAPAIMMLVERGKLDLLKPVKTYLPEFAGPGRDTIIVRQLLTHTSGLRPDLNLDLPWAGYDRAIELACSEVPVTPPDTEFKYSDINFILLGEIVHRVTGRSLKEATDKMIFGPLKMTDTGFLPPADKYSRIAPTERVNGRVLLGIVHDPTARRMGGIAGHAGIFTTAADLARFARMLLNEGTLDGTRVLRPETVRLMTSVTTLEALPIRRGLGWDIDSPYSGPRGKLFPLGSYGHTGWTGTSIWIDPFSKTFWIFLCNWVHPVDQGHPIAIRSRLGTLAAEAIAGFNFIDIPGTLPPRAEVVPTKPNASLTGPLENAQVEQGIDVLESTGFAPLRKLKVGLVTNQSGIDRQRRRTIDVLHKAPEVELKVLFSPEHGLQGMRDERVEDSSDTATGLPVYSLYGARQKPTPEELKGLDALVYDIQDIGCRFYTFISTLGLCMQAAEEAKIRFIILDRMDPINGTEVEGPVYRGKSTFTAFHSLPVRYGMTPGELAQMFKEELQLKTDLTVVPLRGWRREMWFDQTGLPWVNPSPNIRSLTEAALYPGIGLLETTALSVGRGTDTPFEVIGAPYIDDVLLGQELNKLKLSGVRFVPVRFTPQSSIYRNQSCGGVQIILTDRNRPMVELGIAIAQVLEQLYPGKFRLDQFNRLLGHLPTVEAISTRESLPRLLQLWQADLKSFQVRRSKYLLYGPKS